MFCNLTKSYSPGLLTPFLIISVITKKVSGGTETESRFTYSNVVVVGGVLSGYQGAAQENLLLPVSK